MSNPLRRVSEAHFGGGDVTGSEEFQDARYEQEENRGGYLAAERPNTYYLGDGEPEVGASRAAVAGTDVSRGDDAVGLGAPASGARGAVAARS